jgi:hypothetical protein
MRYAFSEVRKTVIGLIGFEVADPVGDVGPSDVPPDVATHYDPGP